MDGTRPILGKDSRKLYDCYLIRHHQLGDQWSSPKLNYLEYARLVRYDPETQKAVRRYAERNEKSAIGMNYHNELMDLFIGQFVAVNYAHTIAHRNSLCASPLEQVPENTRFLSGALQSAVTHKGVINDAIRNIP